MTQKTATVISPIRFENDEQQIEIPIGSTVLVMRVDGNTVSIALPDLGKPIGTFDVPVTSLRMPPDVIERAYVVKCRTLTEKRFKLVARVAQDSVSFTRLRLHAARFDKRAADELVVALQLAGRVATAEPI